jgi:hypothetical protein
VFQLLQQGWDSGTKIRHSILSTVLRDVTLEVKLCAFRNQAFTTFLTAAFDAITSSLSGHTGTETVLLFTGAFGGLVSTEAHGGIFGKFACQRRRGGGTLGG